MLDYLSPLPPVPSGIADYSVDLLRALHSLGRLSGSGDGTVRVVRVPGQEVDASIVEEFSVVSLEEPAAAHGRTPVYQLGNNVHHARIAEMAERAPGIVTLHDIFLHHLLIERTLADADLQGYVEALGRDHGWIGRRVALPPRWGIYAQAGLFALPAHRSLLEAQRGVVVHSDWASRLLAEEDVRVTVRVVPMPMPAPPLGPALDQRAAALRSQWGVPDSAPLLGSFGFQTPIKRTHSAIRALACADLAAAHLVVAGEQSPGLDLGQLATELGVGERVHFVGYLPASDFSAAIRSCNLCVNLRFPTAGETSASLLRILALGRPTVVSDYAQFAELPDEFALKVDLGEDPADPARSDVEVLAATCARALADRESLARRGMRARHWIEQHHHPERCARQFLQACDELSRCSAGTVREVVAPPPTSLTWGEMQCSIEIAGLEGWPVGERRCVHITVHNQSECVWLPADDGDGGMMLEVVLVDEQGRHWGPRRWLPLTHRLPPGAAWRLRVALRRPAGTARLEVEPHVVGGSGVSHLGGERRCEAIGSSTDRERADRPEPKRDHMGDAQPGDVGTSRAAT